MLSFSQFGQKKTLMFPFMVDPVTIPELALSKLPGK